MADKKAKRDASPAELGGPLARFQARLAELVPNALSSDPDSIRQAVSRAAADVGIGGATTWVRFDATYDGDTWTSVVHIEVEF
jgi:hypothetical protein